LKIGLKEELQMTRFRRIGVWVSVAAVIALLSAPAAFADDGHGDRHNGGRDGDDHALTVQNGTTPMVAVDQDNDANEDVNEDMHEDVNDDRGNNVQVAPAQTVVDNDQEVNDLNDDND
jgi:hypothetical protein